MVSVFLFSDFLLSLDLSYNAELCKLRCFPPVALVWDTISGLRIFPNLFSETVVVDSSSALWSYTQGSEKTNALLLVLSSHV